MASNTLKTLSVVALASVLGACASAPKSAPMAEAAPAAPVAAAPAAAPVAVAAPVEKAAAPAATGGLKITPTPVGFLGIHYHRTAKDWAPTSDFSKCDFAQCWGVHAWGDAYSSDTSWFKPTFPIGTDDFGAVIQVKANEDKEIAATADANYILHKGDAKDQGGKDMSWDHNKSKEIFVVQDDPKVYFSADEAMKSPNYK